MKCPICDYEFIGDNPRMNIAEHIKTWHPQQTEEERIIKMRAHPQAFLKEHGFGKMLALVKEGKCPVCEKPIQTEELKGADEWKEWQISGLCGPCQRKRKEGKL